MDDARVEEAIRLYEQGLTLREVADRLPGTVTFNQVAYAFRRRGISLRDRMSTDQVRVDRAHIMWRLGCTKTEIADALQVTWTSADRYLKRESPFSDWRRPANER